MCIGIFCITCFKIQGACQESKKTTTKTIDQSIISNFIVKGTQNKRLSDVYDNPSQYRGQSVIVYSTTECVEGKAKITEEFDFEGKKWIYEH